MSDFGSFVALMKRFGVPYEIDFDVHPGSDIEKWTVLLSPWPKNAKVIGCATLTAVFTAMGEFEHFEIDG